MVSWLGVLGVGFRLSLGLQLPKHSVLGSIYPTVTSKGGYNLTL